jgi:hypothetical protein
MPSFGFGGGGSSTNGATYSGAAWVRSFAGYASGFNNNISGAGVVVYDSITINGTYSNCSPSYSDGYAYLNKSGGGFMYLSRYVDNGLDLYESVGNDPWTNGGLQGTVSWSTVPAVIGAPTATASTTAQGTVSLSWTAPDNGGATITDYRIFFETSADGSTGWSGKTEVTKSASTSTSHTVTGLTVGTYYRFYVNAVNSRGTANYSTVSAVRQAPGNPGAPTALTATKSTAAVGSVVLGWDAPSVVSSGITGYNVYARLSTGSRTRIATLTGTGTSHTATGLVQRGSYTFDITARSAFSDTNSTEGTASAAATAQASGVSSPPLNLVVTTGGLENQLVLNWSAPTDTASALQGYYVYQSTGTLAATISGSTTTATITGLVPGQRYGWDVRARTTLSETLSTFGEASTIIYGVPLGEPDAPTVTSLTVLSTVAGAARLVWIPSPAAVYAKIYRTYPDGSAADSLVASVKGTSYVFYGLDPNTTYYYKMSSVSSTSEGPKTSSSSSITPLSTSVQAITTASTVTNTSNLEVFNGTYFISSILDAQRFSYLRTASNLSSTAVPGSFGVLSNRTGDDLSGTFTISTGSPTSNQFTYTSIPSWSTQNIPTTSVSVSVTNNTSARFNGVYTAQSDASTITYSVAAGSNVSSRAASGTVVNQSNSTYNGVFTITDATETTFTYPAAVIGSDQETTASAGAVDNLTNRTIYNTDETLVTSAPAYNRLVYDAKPSFVNRSYDFATSTADSDPGNGKIRFNNATLGSVSSIYISNKDTSLASQVAWYQMWNDGLSVTNKGKLIVANSSGLWSFTVSGTVVSANGYYRIPVSSPVGTSVPAAGAVAVAFVPFGFTDAPYKFSTSTTVGDPGSGYIRYNASPIGSVTSLIIDRYSSETSPVDRLNWINSWYDAVTSPTGRIFIRSRNTMAEFALTGDAVYVSAGGASYFTVPVIWKSGDAVIMAADFPLLITHVPTKNVELDQPYGDVRKANSIANLEIQYRSGWLG